MRKHQRNAELRLITSSKSISTAVLQSITICLAISVSLPLAGNIDTAKGTDRTEEMTTIADRVVVAINNIPYTQLQLESYLNVKESLRDDAAASQVVKESNWAQALDAFINDMMIHQEATKSSGFRPTKETIQKLLARVEKTAASAPQFKTAFDRLRLTRQELENEILRISTVENYRKGKASLSTNGKNVHDTWQNDLKSRSIVRLFDDAKTWKNIQPLP